MSRVRKSSAGRVPVGVEAQVPRPPSKERALKASPRRPLNLSRKVSNTRVSDVASIITSKISDILNSTGSQPSNDLIHSSKAIPLLPLSKLHKPSISLRSSGRREQRLVVPPPAVIGLHSLNASLNSSGLLSGLNSSAGSTKSSKISARFPSESPRRQGSADLSQVYEGLKLPITAPTALSLFRSLLSDYEQSEILDYSQIYFLGLKAQKARPSPDAVNYGYDDERGDYKIVVADHLAYRYEIHQILGQGSFGQVCRCFDHMTREFVALKLIRNKKRFHHQATVECRILKHLVDNDQIDDNNIVHMRDCFKFRAHTCVTFEILSLNLYEFLKSNNFRGLSLGLIRRFAVQLLVALNFLRKLQIVHCDLKPENILLRTPNRAAIKIIDFGSSCFESERIYTYIQSRFYRAPEIMLGIPYTTAIDMWSFGCIMVELLTGYPLFPGESEVEQLQCIMEYKGVPPDDLLEISPRKKMFFDSDNRPRIVPNSRGKKHFPGTKRLEDLLAGAEAGFLNLVQSTPHSDCLEWDPRKRVTAEDCLKHEWVRQALARPPTTSRMNNVGESGARHERHLSRVQETPRRSKKTLPGLNTSSVV